MSRALRAELDRLATRCAAAERQAEELADELARARAQLAAQEQTATTGTGDQLHLFDGAGPAARVSGDGSDRGVLPIALGATAVVSAMVVLLAALNGRFFSTVGILMTALTVVLAYFAWQTRVIHTRAEVNDGVVYLTSQGSTHSFDLRAASTRLEVVGEPADSDWEVRFLRRGLDPFVIDSRTVDPVAFMQRLREVRPDL